VLNTSKLTGVAYPRVRDNRSTLNTKTGYDDDDNYQKSTVSGILHHDFSFLQLRYDSRKKKVKEVNLYCAFIVVPQTQCTQVRITQCYLQITPYLPLPHKRSPDGAYPD